MKQFLVVLFLLILLVSNSVLASDDETLRRYLPFARNREQVSLADQQTFLDEAKAFQQDNSSTTQSSVLVLSEHMRYDQFASKQGNVYLVDEESNSNFCLLKIDEQEEQSEQIGQSNGNEKGNQIINDSFELSLLQVVRDESKVSKDSTLEDVNAFRLENEIVAPEKSLSLRGRQSPVRHQGSRNTCTIFASIAALECQLGGGPDLSEQDAYWLVCRDINRPFLQDRGVWPVDAARTLTNSTVCREVDWPYEKVLRTGKRPLRAGKRSAYRFNSTSSFTGNSTTGRRRVRSALAKGSPVVACFKVAWDDSVARRNGRIDVVIDPKTKKPVRSSAGHCMLIVGYDDVKKHYIVKNSWGRSWGDRGYGYISFAYYNEYAYSSWYTPNSARGPKSSGQAFAQAEGFTQ